MQWLNTIAIKTAALRQVCGAHLFLNREGERELCFVVLQQKKQQLLLVAQGTLSWAAFLQQHNKAIPIALSIDGKGVLTKSIAATDNVVLEEVLPNASEEDFYYNSLTGPAATWVSLTRKTVLQEIMQETQAAGISLAAVHVGPLGIASLLPLLQEHSMITLPHWQLQQHEGQLSGLLAQLPAEDASYRLGEEEVAAAYLQPYANALTALVKLEPYAGSNLTEVALLWFHKRLYKRLSVGLLVFFFSLLLLNFGLFSYLSNTQQELQGRLQQHQHFLGKLQALQKQEESRHQLLQAIPLKQQTLFAYYADLLAASVPVGLQLEQLVLHPEESRQSKRQSLHFQHGLVAVSGKCNNPVLLNRWLEKLEQEGWVKAVKDQRYSSGTAGQAESSFGFTLEVRNP